MGRVGQELRYAVRTAIRTRSVSILAVLAFALGIGVTSALFSIFNSVLLAPLPFPDPDQLVAVYGTQPACATCPASFPKYHDWKTRNQVFAAMGGWTQASFVLTGMGSAEQVSGLATTASVNDVFRVRPQVGRWYTDAEDQPGGPKLVVLNYRFWQRRFNGDASIVGKRVIFDGDAYEVIGVMPKVFVQRNVDFYVPLQRKLDPATRGNHFLVTFARLKPGVPLDRAIREMRALGEVLAREFHYNHGIDVRSYREVIVGQIRKPLQVLMGAVLCVLLIACANVANLLLAAGLSRRREIAVRLALGAGQGTLARQLTAEALVLAARRRRARTAARDLDRARVRRARHQQSAARQHHPGGRPGARLHGRHLDPRRRRLRPLAVAAPAAEDADNGVARKETCERPVAATSRSGTAL